eukprot:GHUV01041821.1.p1 GENE.GHUV01041821.1~~GHUV01041821.1.p1  ORF type:complete len:108 (-),score=8.62 GHUV01041821.1:347-670(-)
MSDSFGYLTKKGYCAGGKCLQWPVLMGEFSAPHSGKPRLSPFRPLVPLLPDATPSRHHISQGGVAVSVLSTCSTAQQAPLSLRHLFTIYLASHAVRAVQHGFCARIP